MLLTKQRWTQNYAGTIRQKTKLAIALGTSGGNLGFQESLVKNSFFRVGSWIAS